VFGVVRKRPSVVIPHRRSSASRLCQPCILVPDSIRTSIGAEFGRASKAGRLPNRLMSSSLLNSCAPYAAAIWRTRTGVNPKLAPTSAVLFPILSARITRLFLFVLRRDMVSPPFHKYRYSTFLSSSKTRFMCGPMSWAWKPSSVHICSMVVFSARTSP